MSRGVEMELGPKQELFAKLLGQFLNWIHTHPTWRVRLAEGFVGYTDAADGDYDGPHLRGGAHYNKLAQDIDLFLIDSAGARVHVIRHSAEWDEMGATWKALHPLCRWGGDFKSKDYNHFSIIHGGKS